MGQDLGSTNRNSFKIGYVRERLLPTLATQVMRDKGLGKRYNIQKGLYVATPSQSGGDTVVFCPLWVRAPLRQVTVPWIALSMFPLSPR